MLIHLYLTEDEKTLLSKLGLTLEDNTYKAASEDLKYLGFGVYIDNDARVFEKCGEELVEKKESYIQAAQRYMQKKS